MVDEALFSSERQDWGTPKDLFDRLHRIFNFQLDVAANEHNHKAATWYGAGGCEEDGLEAEWCPPYCEGMAWCNPPYGRGITGLWVQKAIKEHVSNGCPSVLLLPARTDTAWFQEGVRYAYNIVFIRGRLKFEGAEHSAPFPSCLMIFGETTMLQRNELLEIGVVW